jgi:archaellum component FlaC
MRANGDAYFAEWEKSAATITNEDIKKISDQRRAELQKSYKDLQNTMTTVAADAKPLREQLISLREYYLQDLTEKGIEATKTPISNAKSASTKVTKGIKTVLDEVDKVATQLKVATPPPPPADGKPPEKK